MFYIKQTRIITTKIFIKFLGFCNCVNLCGCQGYFYVKNLYIMMLHEIHEVNVKDVNRKL